MNKCERCKNENFELFGSGVSFVGAGTYILCIPCRRAIERTILVSPEWAQFRRADAEYARYVRGVPTNDCDWLIADVRAAEEAMCALVDGLVLLAVPPEGEA